jgi:hypothetical protein
MMSTNEKEVKKEADKTNQLLEALSSPKPPLVFSATRRLVLSENLTQEDNGVVIELNYKVEASKRLSFLRNESPKVQTASKVCKPEDVNVKL